MVVVGALLVQVLVVAGNALFLRRRRRLAVLTTGPCHTHRWQFTRVGHHLLNLPSYELLQFVVSSLGCASFVWYRCGPRTLLPALLATVT